MKAFLRVFKKCATQKVCWYLLGLACMHYILLLSYTFGQRDELVLHFRKEISNGVVIIRHPQQKQNETKKNALTPLASKATNITVALLIRKRDGDNALSQQLSGMLFEDGSKLGSMEGEITSEIVWSLVRSFSPQVDNHVRDIFQDEYEECKFFPIIPTIVHRNGEVLVAQRVWLAQYEYRKRELRRKQLSMDGMNQNWMNTWQENYLYHMRMDENYEALEPGELVGIPSTTNIMFTYKSDGVMDPRFVKVGTELLLMFHTWLIDKNSNDAIGGRVHLWNWDKHYKRKLKVPGLPLLRTEINWIPMDVNGSLYLTYSLDPLRVMTCVIATGDCKFVFEQPGSKEHTFTYSLDRLRGGTPFIVYKYPYYIGVAHSVGTSYTPALDYSVYSTHFVVLSVDPWRLVYVSRHIDADGMWLRSKPVVRNHTIIGEFWYPMGIIKWNDDIIDVSCHLNDYNGHVVRLRGIERLMREVMSKDMQNVAMGTTLHGPKTRVIQQYVLEALKHRMPMFSFQGDLILKTPV